MESKIKLSIVISSRWERNNSERKEEKEVETLQMDEACKKDKQGVNLS